MLQRLKSTLLQEPLAAIALIVRVLMAVFQSTWFANIFRHRVVLNVYYYRAADGRVKFSPRIANASHEGGRLQILNHGECYAGF